MMKAVKIIKNPSHLGTFQFIVFSSSLCVCTSHYFIISVVGTMCCAAQCMYGGQSTRFRIRYGRVLL